MPKRNKIILVKEHSREYSLFHIVAYNDILKLTNQKIGCQVKNELFLYKDLVETYHEPTELKEMFAFIAQKAQDEKFVEKVITDLNSALENILPYLNEEKYVKDLKELKELYNLFLKFYEGIAYVWVIPSLESVPERLRQQALASRVATERYSSKRDQLFVVNLKKLYPDLKDLVMFLLPAEVFDEKINKDIVKILQERSQGCIFYCDEIFSGDRFKNFFADHNVELAEVLPEVDKQEITGAVAFGGRVRGLVKKVSIAKDLSKIDWGDILVAPMTRPEYLPGMKKAAAFVTDEGGITCHAAIVAREMKKPCVIGTKIATQVLKDGMMVEVDADNGVVKILNKDLEEYSLHFRQIDFPFIFTNITFRPENYGQFDYVVLQEEASIAAYLSPEGIQQAYNFGKNLLDRKFANNVIYKLEVLLSELEQSSVLNIIKTLSETELASRWAMLESICDKISNLYLFCEHPIVAALEETVVGACLGNRNLLVKVLHDPKYAEGLKFNAVQKEYLDRLVHLGELKFKIHNAIGPLFEEIYSFAQILADKYDLSLEEVLLLTNNEIVQLISNGKLFDKEEIRSRMDGLVFLPKRESKILTGDNFNFWRSKLEPKEVSEVRGTVAYPGKVRGIVKVHLSLISGGEIPAGTVLVSGMTNPQIVPFLKNAVAIITDEGGITCHAAIVARELKKPCIISTKIATQVLHDGDLVEVDADKGIIKIL